jgi:hypothetical protein
MQIVGCASWRLMHMNFYNVRWWLMGMVIFHRIFPTWELILYNGEVLNYFILLFKVWKASRCFVNDFVESFCAVWQWWFCYFWWSLIGDHCNLYDFYAMELLSLSKCCNLQHLCVTWILYHCRGFMNYNLGNHIWNFGN